MKLRHRVGCTAAAAVALGAWLAWDPIRHARENLVTLRGRDLPLAKVLDQFQRQTRERLVADPRLAADTGLRVNLDLRAAPLAEALAILAEQTGGFWRTVYAVHSRPDGATQLAGLLLKGTDPTQAGWTNLTQRLPDVELPPPGEGPIIRPFPGGAPLASPAGAPGGRRLVTVEADETVGGPGPGPFRHVSGPGGDQAEVEVVQPPPGKPTVGTGGDPRGPGGRPRRRLIIRARDAEGGGAHTFDLSPERLLLERRLLSRIEGGSVPDDLVPSPQDAARLARLAGGQWSTLYALEPLPLPGLQGEVRRMLTRDRLGSSDGRRPSAAAENRPEPPRDPAELAARAEADIRRGQFDRIERLTPEQRARQAGQAAGRSREPHGQSLEERE